MKIVRLFNILFLFAIKSQPCGTSYQMPLGAVSPRSVAFSPNGSYLAVANFTTNNVTMFNSTEGVLSNAISYPQPDLINTDTNSLAFSPNGSYLATANSNSHDVTLFNVVDGSLSAGTSYQSGLNPCGVTFSPDGSLLAIVNNGVSADVTLFKVVEGVLSGMIQYALPVGSIYPQSLAFAPDGNTLVTANYGSNNVTLFTVSNGALSIGTSYSLPLGSTRPSSVAFSPDGSYIATANEGSNNVTLFLLAAESLTDGISYMLPSNSAYPKALAFSPDGSHLAVANYSNVTIFAVNEGVLMDGISYALPLGTSGPLSSLAFSPDGSYLALSAGSTNEVTIFNTTAWCPATTIPSPTTGDSLVSSLVSTSTTGHNSNPTSCSNACIVGISIGSFAALTVAGAGAAILLKRYCSRASSEQQKLINS